MSETIKFDVDFDYRQKDEAGNGWAFFIGKRDNRLQSVNRYRTYEYAILGGLDAGFVFDNGGWKQKLFMWNWHNVSLDGYPGWEMEGASPAWCRIEHVNGDTWAGGKAVSDREPTKSSEAVMNAWDNEAKELFYSRDISYDGHVSVCNREAYGSLWWFHSIKERDRFLEWLPTFDATIPIIHRSAATLPKDER